MATVWLWEALALARDGLWLWLAVALRQSRLTYARLLETFKELALVALTAHGGSEQLWEAALAWCNWLAAEGWHWRVLRLAGCGKLDYSTVK